MVFKLTRIDSQESRKIDLVIGKHVIGRGKFLHDDDQDKRVSRSHAELDVTMELLSLKSLHQNPCFYIKRNTKDTEIIHQNNSIVLKAGDKFGLLPDNFWFEVIQCLDSDRDDNKVAACKDNEKDSIKQCLDSDTAEKAESVKDIGGIDDVVNGMHDVPANVINTETNINFGMQEDVESDRSASPSLLPTEAPNQESTQTYNLNDKVNDPSTNTKRGHDSLDASPVDSKKVKTEPTSPGPQPGPSNDQAQPDAADKDQKPNLDAPNSPAKPPQAAQLRERCMYGANCYRRNPEHKARFSHPSDLDWGGGERGVCPYGAACRRNDPRHWQHHEHPPGVNQPQPNNVRRPGQQRKKKMKRRASDSESNDDGDSPRPDLIVTGKRSRKTVNRDILGIYDSEEEEDPYGTDESDEWQPPSDFTNSEDFSQNL